MVLIKTFWKQDEETFTLLFDSRKSADSLSLIETKALTPRFQEKTFLISSWGKASADTVRPVQNSYPLFGITLVYKFGIIWGGKPIYYIFKPHLSQIYNQRWLKVKKNQFIFFIFSFSDVHY